MAKSKNLSRVLLWQYPRTVPKRTDPKIFTFPKPNDDLSISPRMFIKSCKNPNLYIEITITRPLNPARKAAFAIFRYSTSPTSNKKSKEYRKFLYSPFNADIVKNINIIIMNNNRVFLIFIFFNALGSKRIIRRIATHTLSQGAPSLISVAIDKTIWRQ